MSHVNCDGFCVIEAFEVNLSCTWHVDNMVRSWQFQHCESQGKKERNGYQSGRVQ